jgi:hypothetical protein
MNKNHSENQSGSDSRSNDVDLKELNRRHLSSIDKFYRMCAGAGSEITAFEDGTIYLAITVDDRRQPPFDEIVAKIARSWLHEEKRKNASRYVAVIFHTDGRLGALVNPSTSTPDQLAHQVVKAMRPATKPDVPIAVICGRFS